MSDILTPNSSSFAARFLGCRDNRSRTVMLAFCLGWAALMGLLAQVRIPLWFTPVPFTMQVFGILLGGVILGTRYGALAQVMYVGIGILGMPPYGAGSVSSGVNKMVSLMTWRLPLARRVMEQGNWTEYGPAS